MYQKLMSIGQIAPVPLVPLQSPYPNWYKPDLTCEYHAGIAGHSIHICNALKRKLLQLIKVGWITFKEPPNISTNPLPIHVVGNGSVNTFDTRYPKSLKVLMEKVYQMLIRARYDDIRCCQYHDQEGHLNSNRRERGCDGNVKQRSV